MHTLALRPARLFRRLLGLGLIAAVCVLLIHERASARQASAADPAAAAPARRAGPVRVVVSIPPLLWAARELVPESSEITLLVPPGASEHGLELTPGQVKAIHDADLVLMVGLGLEPRVKQVLDAAPQHGRRVVSFDDAGADAIISEEADHDHGAADHHHHHDIDPHIWLDPSAMEWFIQRLADTITAPGFAGVIAGPDGGPLVDTGAISRRAESARATCRSIDSEYTESLSRLKNRTLVTHHSAFTYLARRYKLEVAAVIRPVVGVEPTPGDVDRAARAIRERGLGALFIEPQFAPEGARRIAEIAGVKTITLDPLGDGNWPGLMRRNLSALVEGLSATPARTAP